MTVTLDQVIRSYFHKRLKTTLHGYPRALNFLLDFVRKFSLNHGYMDKTVGLKMDTKKAIAFPQDCIKPSKIGWQTGDRVVGFEIDNSIAKLHDYCDDGVSATANTAFDAAQGWPYNGDFQFTNYLTLDGTVNALTGYKIGNNGAGYFTIDWKKREIQFSSEVKSAWTIYIEYKTNGFEPKTKSVIPEFASTLAEDYIHWQLARFDKRYGDASVETLARKEAFWNSYDELNAQMDMTSLEDITGARARSFSINKIMH